MDPDTAHNPGKLSRYEGWSVALLCAAQVFTARKPPPLDTLVFETERESGLFPPYSRELHLAKARSSA